jgi:putative FmdB family regulatory protein
MPLYDYKCNGCGQTTEMMHAVHAAQPRKCPSCGKMRLTRVTVPSSPATLHMRYSLMHPRYMRGQRR